jgi:hypothetical protein
MPKRTHFCFYCRGAWDINDPDRSALMLAGNEPLTVGDFRNLDLSRSRLAALAAWETGMIDAMVVPDEFAGMLAALLEAAGLASWPHFGQFRPTRPGNWRGDCRATTGAARSEAPRAVLLGRLHPYRHIGGFPTTSRNAAEALYEPSPTVRARHDDRA